MILISFFFITSVFNFLQYCESTGLVTSLLIHHYHSYSLEEKQLLNAFQNIFNIQN